MPAYFLFPLAIVAAYLLGSVPFAIISSKLFGLADPRSYGSKNPGATNVLRSGNKMAALLTLIGDCAKGAVAVLVAQYFSVTMANGQALVVVVALAVFFGHLYPLFLGFKGGKGVATAAGILLAIDPRLGLTTLAVWLSVAFIFRYSSLSALVAALLAPVCAVLLWGADTRLWAVAIIAFILIGKHWQNLQRLMAGTEPKIGGKGGKKPR